MNNSTKYLRPALLLIIFLLISQLHAQTYINSITAPATGTECRAGYSCKIDWTFDASGFNDPDELIGFIIEYGTGSLSNFQVDGLIADSPLMGQGFATYTWVPPSNISGNYNIRIRDIIDYQSGPNGYLAGAIDGVNILEAYYINVTAPTSGTITNGEDLNIAYTTNASNIQVYLRNSSYVDTQIYPDGGGAWTGNNNWTIPSNQAEGDYWIVVKGDNAPDGISAQFRIEPKRLVVTYPYNGLIFERGVAKPMIRWTANYIPSEGVKITIETNQGIHELVNGAGPNNYFPNVETNYKWEIPDSFEKGLGFIQIKDKVLYQVSDYQDGTVTISDPYEESFTLNSAKSTSVSKPITDYSEIDGLSNTEKSESISYVDGTGKVRQSVSLNSSPNEADMISFSEYNELGQKVIEYLPYASDEVDGLYITTTKEDQESFYNSSNNTIATNSHPYSRTIVEASPLQTVKEQGAPGANYQPGSGNTIRYETHANSSTDQVVHWKISDTSILGQGYYPASSLIISKTMDEDENESYVYTDREGREVLKVGYQNPTTPVKTYYVYDDFGNLSFIIPPEAVDEIEALTNYQSTTINSTNTIRTTWFTEMRYDGYQRVVWKKIPEAEPVYTVYDKFGRVALTQDGNMRPNNEWFFTKYDIQGRAILTGLYVEEDASRDTREEMQTYLTSWTGAPWEDRTSANYSTQHGYTNQTFPNPTNMEGLMIWSVTYYDDYDFNNDGTPDESYVDNTEFTGTGDGMITNPEVDIVRTHGMVTGSKTRILYPQQVYESDAGVYGQGQPSAADEVYLIGTSTNNYQIRLTPGFDTKPGQTLVVGGSDVGVPSAIMNEYTQGEWLEGVTFYDKYGRSIYTKSTNHVGGQDQSWTQYYFDGRVDRTKTVHSSTSSTTTVRQRMEYDHAGRVLAEYHTIDGGAEKKISENSFNEIGQLTTKKLGNTSGSSFLQTLNYTYHLRGWLTSVNNPDNLGSDLFAYRLYYDTTPSVAQSLNKFNGNIIAMDWRTKTPSIAERHRYDYSYDGLNQLTTARKMRWIPSCQNNCTEWTNYYEGWSGTYSYDLNGNIKTLNRAGTTYYNDDQLSYTYSGNQIQSITDNASSTYKNNGFVDGASVSEEYLYDANGNMYTDLNKGITAITYNRMNLPEVITFSSGNEIHYLYDAAGSKLQKITYPASGGQTTTDYSGGFVYTDNTVDFFAFSEGRVRKVSGNWQYEYDLKDHLGNVRATFTNNNGMATLLQADSYYPFGYKMPGLSYQNGAENKFTYNGKELEDEFGLDWYHYGARYYDPILGRWWTKDAAEEFSSAYNYVGNNPIIFIDPDGNLSTCIPPIPCNPVTRYVTEKLSNTWDRGMNAVDEFVSDVTDLGRSFWNNPYTRSKTGDMIATGFRVNTYGGPLSVGGSAHVELNWMLRGPEASLFPVLTITESVGGGLDLGVERTFTRMNYLGPVSDLSRDMFNVEFSPGQMTNEFNGGLGAFGATLGVGFSYTPTPELSGYGIIGREVNIGFGTPGISGSITQAATQTFYDANELINE